MGKFLIIKFENIVSNGLIVRNLLMPQNINLMHLMQKLTAILSESAAQTLPWLLCLEHQHVVDQTPLLHRHVRHLLYRYQSIYQYHQRTHPRWPMQLGYLRPCLLMTNTDHTLR